MANGIDVHPKELEFRRRWYEAHVRLAEAAPDYVEFSSWILKYRAGAVRALAIRDDLAVHRDLERFGTDLQAWASGPDTEGFRGPCGSGLVNSLVKHADDPAVTARLLIDGLAAPRDRETAGRKIDDLIEHVKQKSVGGHMVPGHVPFLLSYFWGLEQGGRWPVPTPSNRKFLEFVTGASFPSPSGERYLRYADMVKKLDDDPDRFQSVASWWNNEKPVFLDSVFLDRAAFGLDPNAVDEATLRRNADALVSFGDYLGERMVKDLEKALGFPLRFKVSPVRVKWSSGRIRSDFWVDWQFEHRVLILGGGRRLWQRMGLRLGINHKGAAIGIVPGWPRRRYYEEAIEVIKEVMPEFFREILITDDLPEDEAGFLWPIWDPYSMYGRWYGPDQLSDLDLRAEAIEVASAARPTVNKLINFYGGPALPPVSVRIEEAARGNLLVDSSFLYDIVGLLEDKGQVILYGPPGTGKTFLARRLAEALAPDPACRALVQFHPSTSYEDFFEGYRPEQTADGGIGYRLTPGPLARMAEHAAGCSEAEGRHVMVVDEINRANLPRVLGELLFLFEYRDEWASTLYRSDEGFCLPESLWFIGTMNTADRSIALVDAALRRRFHFVPFFPGRGPTVGLLGRWLAKTGGPGWVGELVEMVNGELAEAIGEDLQLGFSHFMREGYLPEPGVGDGVLRRIWKYNIEPFVEDQLFGDQDRINRFRFEQVVARFRDQAGYSDREDGAVDPSGELRPGVSGPGGEDPAA